MDSNTMLLHVECTYFFEENPYALETKYSLAERLGRSADDLEPVLDRLVTLTVLTKTGEGDFTIYRYQQPYTIQDKLGTAWTEI